MSCIDHGGAEKQVQLKLSLLGIVPNTETDEHPRCALRMQSRSGWGEWGRWRQQQPIRLCPIDAADGRDGMARVPPALRLGKKTQFRPKNLQRSALVLRGGWRVEPSPFSLGGGNKRASRESQPSVECCCVRRREGFAGAKKGLLLPAPNDIRGFFFGGALEIVEPEAVIDFFFGYALACTGHVPRNAKQALELVSAAELDGGLLTLLLLLSPCWRWRCRAKATCIPMLVRLQGSEGHSERGGKKGRGSCIAISSLPALLAAPLVPPEGPHFQGNERTSSGVSIAHSSSIYRKARLFWCPTLET